MPSITVEQRRRRLGIRHHLAAESRAADVVDVAGQLVGLHSTDPATVVLSASARTHEPALEAVEAALYDDRSVVRMLGMRRTVFVVPIDLAPIVQAACAGALVPGERKRLVELLEGAGITKRGGPWLRRVETATLDALRARGEATAVELSADVPDLKRKIAMGEGKKWAGEVGVVTRVLFLLAAEGQIVRGRPKGSWTSSQYRWAPMDTWLPGPPVEWAVDDARVELARRWLAAFGPATAADLKWWTGWTMSQLRKALAVIEPTVVDLEGVEGLVLADDADLVEAPEPWAALLPGLDPTSMGWTDRDWFLGEHRPVLFDRSGNIGPTVWWDGRIVGAWAQRRDGEIVIRILTDIGSDAMTVVEREAEALQLRLGPVRVTPRFRTPLERELAG